MSRSGENIDAHCLKCKHVLAHIVMYEVNGSISKVKCKTCGAEHKYRGVKPPAQKKGPTERGLKEKRTKAAVGKMAVNPAPIQWETRRRNLDPEIPVKPYRIQDHYQVSDVIRHPAFGLGFIEKIVTNNRMEVLFQEAIKSMAMNIV
jgi:hypothetical protein